MENSKFMDSLLTLAGKMQSNKVLNAISAAFIDFMPVTITGSLAVLFRWVISQTGGVTTTLADGTEKYTAYLSVANLPGMKWLSALNPFWDTVNYGCVNFIAVGICVLVALHFAENLGREKDYTAAMVALGCFIATAGLQYVTDDAGTKTISSVTTLTTDFTSASGLFVALIMGILATLLYVKLGDSGKLTIKLPDTVPPNVVKSFEVLFPSMLTIFIVVLIAWALMAFTGVTLFNLINTIMAPLQNLMTGLPGACVIGFFAQLLWWFGIHGNNVLSPVMTPFLTTSTLANLEAYNGDPYALPNIITNQFMSFYRNGTGSGVTIGWIIAVFLFSKREDFKAIAKLAIPCGIFNINEPIIFGVPMVMNPLFAIPWFAAPICVVIVGYILTAINLTPRFAIDVPWTTPIGIGPFLAAGGNIMAAIVNLVVVIGVSTLIYAPFVIAANSQTEEA